MLEGMSARITALDKGDWTTASVGSNAVSRVHPKRLFIVHGHDTEAKESAARFVERLGLEPINPS
jgi:hypothetical protein